MGLSCSAALNESSYFASVFHTLQNTPLSAASRSNPFKGFALMGSHPHHAH